MTKMNPATTTTQTIQSILTPAVMVSATALFLLGLNARYVAVLTRIRALCDEQRRLSDELAEYPGPQTIHAQAEQTRLMSIASQINTLLRTAWCLRSSIICHIFAALLFVLTSCTIGFDLLLTTRFFLPASLYLFMTGMLVLLVGIILLGIDIMLSFSAILVEVEYRKPKP